MGTMGVKLGTKAFGDIQGSVPSSEINNKTNNLSVGDQAKFGDQSVGDVLNKLADPNWVDPAKKLRTVGNDKLDKDAFFKLMIAQMKNQDPTNPLKSHEMAAQLANFSGLEQMQNMNSTLTEMKNAQRPQENYQALNLIGKAVAGDSSKVARSQGDREHEFKFNLPMDTTDVNVKVFNAEGEVIRSYDMKNLKKGENKITWNGQDDKGTTQHPGEYRFAVEAKAGDKKVAVKTEFEGVISGINYTNEGPVLLVGNQSIRMRDVRKITDPSLMSNDQKVTDVTAQDLKIQGDTDKTKTEGNKESAKAAPTAQATSAAQPAPAAPIVKSNIMDNVGLSREMMARLAKETR
ncbi:flagellar hook assembly protein FlgD [Bdellovibrio sp. HCB337]|uniref:flagellar hook assembly protein FlgD n=1 Tax=Bdellovibrio sp. HCB337 TaxID=3394358 RepID=UPI0039A72628